VDRVDLGVPGLVGARLIGRGGFGTVYAAAEPEFGRTVAVKVLRERLDDEAVRRAFERECRAMGSVSGHPHIVTVHRGGTTAAGAPYIVMDLMSGGSLADRVARAPLAWPEVLETGVLLAGALETAHRSGILHLDLKPANVLVSRFGEPKLGDFGISRLPGVAETSDAVRASPAFAAPERLAEGTATVATDLYGLGATLFTLLAGAPAFRGEGAELIVVLARILREPVPDLRGRGVPDAVCRVLERLMAKSPGDRPATAAEAAEALRDAQRATGRPLTRLVVEGAPTSAQEAAAATSVTVEPPPPPPPAAPQPGPVGVARPGPPPWSPRSHPLPPPPAASWAQPTAPSRRGLLVAIGVGAGVLVVAAGAAAAVLLGRAPAGAAPGPTAAPATSAPATSTTAPITTAPTATAPVAGSVTVAAGVDGPGTEDALRVLDAYVTAIDEERYVDAFALFSPDSATAQDGLPAWLDAQQPRSLSDARLVAVRPEGPADLGAVLTFRSRQDPAYSPDGTQDCLDWELSYELAGPGPEYLIRSSALVAEPRPC
jgi:non-specific serine/threonine protein kinase